MSSSLGKSASHLFLRGTKFYYRKVLPPDLYDKIGIKEIKISLGSSSIKEARFLSSWLDLQMNRFVIFFRRVRPVDDEQLTQIRNLAIEWVRKKKEELQNLRAMGINDFIVQIDGETGEKVQTTSNERIEAFQEALEFEREKLKGNLLSDTWIETVACRIAGENEIPVPKEGEHLGKENLAYRRLCMEIRKAFLDLGKEEIDRMDGFYGEYQKVAQENQILPLVTAPKQQQQKQQQKQSQRLSKLLESYLNSKREQKIRKKSISEIEKKCGLFIEVTEDPFVDDLEDQMIFDYLDALRKIPARRTKIKKYRNKSVKELLQKKIPEDNKMEEETLRNHINKVKSFVQWLEKRRYLHYGKFSSLFDQKKRTRRPHEAKNVFSPEDLQSIFNHKNYLEFKKAWEFWPPLIALFTGMRINEICQLHLDDIVKEGEIWYISIIEGEGKTLKTASSIRDVPLHKELLEIGLPSYVRRLRRKGHKYLFPDRIGNKTSPSKTPGRKLNEWIKQIGIKDDAKKGKKTFHSFRHTFASRCKELGLNAEETAEILGHSEGKGGGMRQIYAKPTNVKKLYDDIISKLDYELDLTHLKEYMEECDYDPWSKKKKTAKKNSGK